MADIWLMRHGAYEGHRPGYHAPHEAALTQEGREQVRRSLPLPGGVTAIVTSPIPRARQTATLVSHLTGLPIVATSGLLAEWRAPSIVLGRTAETYPPAYRAWRNSAPRQSLPTLRRRRKPHRPAHPRPPLRQLPPPHRPTARAAPGGVPHPPAGRPHPPRGRPRRLHNRGE